MTHSALLRDRALNPISVLFHLLAWYTAMHKLQHTYLTTSRVSLTPFVAMSCRFKEEGKGTR